MSESTSTLPQSTSTSNLNPNPNPDPTQTSTDPTTIVDSTSTEKKKKKKKKKKSKTSTSKTGEGEGEVAEREEEEEENEIQGNHHEPQETTTTTTTAVPNDKNKPIQSNDQTSPSNPISAALMTKSPSNTSNLPKELKVQSKDLQRQAEVDAAKKAVEIIIKKEKEDEKEREVERKSSRAELVVRKRAKAISKKLARISTYESLSNSQLNEDQIRSRESKPALEMALNELNEVSKVLELEKEEYKKEEEEKIEVEVRRRLEKLSKSQSQPKPQQQQQQQQQPKQETTTTTSTESLRSSTDSSLLSLLLQFLHLHSIVLPTPGSKGLNPSLLPTVLENATPNQVAAIGSLHEKFVNGPLLGGKGDALEAVSNLEKGSQEEIVNGVTYKEILDLILSLTAPPTEPEINAPISFIPIPPLEETKSKNQTNLKTNGSSILSERELIISLLKEAEAEKEKESISTSTSNSNSTLTSTSTHVPVGIQFTLASELEEDEDKDDFENKAKADVKEKEENKINVPLIEEKTTPVIETTSLKVSTPASIEISEKQLEPEGGVVDSAPVSLGSETDSGEKGGKGIVSGELPSANKEKLVEEVEVAEKEKEGKTEPVITETVQPSTTTKSSEPITSSNITSIPRATQSSSRFNWADEDDGEDDLGDPEEFASTLSPSTGPSTPAPLSKSNGTPGTNTPSPSNLLLSKATVSTSTTASATASNTQTTAASASSTQQPSVQRPVAPKAWGKLGSIPSGRNALQPSTSPSSQSLNTHFPKVSQNQNQNQNQKIPSSPSNINAKVTSPTPNENQRQTSNHFQGNDQQRSNSNQNYHHQQNQNQQQNQQQQHQQQHYHQQRTNQNQNQNQNGFIPTNQNQNRYNKPNGNYHSQQQQNPQYSSSIQQSSSPLTPRQPEIDEDGFKTIGNTKKFDRMRGRGGFALKGSNRGGGGWGNGNGGRGGKKFSQQDTGARTFEGQVNSQHQQK